MSSTGSLLIIEGEKVTVSPEALLHKPYADIWNRDDNKDKHVAIKELSYIHLYNCFNTSNPYRHWPEEDRSVKIKESIKLGKNWKPDNKVKIAEELYNDLQNTRSMMFVVDAQYGVDQLRKYFRAVDYTMLDDKGAMLYKPTDLVRILKDSESLLAQLEKLTDKVKNETIGSGTIRGGGEAGYFED